MLLSILQSISANLIYFMLHLTQNNSFEKPPSPKEEREELIKFHENGVTVKGNGKYERLKEQAVVNGKINLKIEPQNMMLVKLYK